MTSKRDSLNIDLIVDKLKKDLDYYKSLLQESEEKWGGAKSDYELYRDLSIDDTIDIEKIKKYRVQYTLVVNDLNKYNDERNEYQKIVSSIENLIKKYENTYEKELKLSVGDYISLSDGDCDCDCILTQIVKVNQEYFLIDVDTFENEFESFSSLEELNNFIENGEINATCYYVDNDTQELSSENEMPSVLYRYLVYDGFWEEDFEVAIIYDDTEDLYYIMTADLNEAFYEDSFNSFHEAFTALHESFCLVKRLRS